MGSGFGHGRSAGRECSPCRGPVCIGRSSAGAAGAATVRPLARTGANGQVERRSGGEALETDMTAAALIAAAAISLPSINLPKIKAPKAPPIPHLNIRMHDWAKPDEHGEPRAVVEFEWHGKLMLAR